MWILAVCLTASLNSTPVTSLSFAEAINLALKQNPSNLVALEEISRAYALVEQIRSASLPTLNGNLAYTRLDRERSFGDRVIAGRDQLAASVQLTVPLVATRNWAQWSRALDSASIAKFGAEDLRRQTAIAAARAYLSVVSQHRAIGADIRARDAAKAHLEFSHARFVGGVGNRLDEVRADQEYSASMSAVEKDLGTLGQLQEALGTMLGLGSAVDAFTEPALPIPQTAEVAVIEAESNRSDVKLAKGRQRAAERSAQKDWTDYVPLLSAVAAPFYQDPPTLLNPRTGGQAQLVLTIPFYDGGLRYGAAHERQSLLKEARVQVDGTLRQVRSEVRSAFQEVQHVDEALRLKQRAAALSKESLDLATLAYRAGATTNIEVIDAERQSRDALAAEVVAEDLARQSRLDLLAASGRFP